MLKGFWRFRLCLLVLVISILVSCGIEDYIYMDPVDPGIPLTLNTQAFVRLPQYSTDQQVYFRYFVIYYRIYISGLLVTGTVSTNQMDQINSALSSDYQNLFYYTNNDNTVPTTMGDIFLNQKYYPLALENNAISSYLGSGSLGNIITLDFARPPPLRPAFFLGDTREDQSLTPINLWRHSENGKMFPYANNRFFTNHSDINTSEFINQTTFTNLDIADNKNVSGPKYTYVSMYILAYGMDNNFSSVYSTPTHIGIFLLPD